VEERPVGSVEAIWLKRAVRGPMDRVEQARAVAGEGFEGDANRGRSQRQVTVIERETFDRLRRELPDASPEMRRANLMVSGVRLAGSRGRILAVGEVRLEIRGETLPCERMDEQCDGLREALEPLSAGGVYGVVLEGGVVEVGDAAEIDPPG
jgi:MOSC domain-containing protein YiiM